MYQKKVCKAEIYTLLVKLLLENKYEEKDIAHTADDDQKDEEDKDGD